MARNWKECSKRNPCQICGYPNWCSYTVDGGMRKCRRLLDGIVVRSDTLGEYSLYPVEGAAPVRQPKPEVQEPPCASAEEISILSQKMLAVLPLKESHKENLLARGLHETWIEIAGYKSYDMTMRRKVLQELWSEYRWDLIKYPGFYKTKDFEEKDKLDLACVNGILIPARDYRGEIAAMRIRLDVPMDGTKYIWVSSAGRGGPSSKSHCHISLGEMKDGLLRVTEGELKADVCTFRTGILSVSVPGATNISRLVSSIDPLHPKKVLLAWDADKNIDKVNAQGRHVNHIARGLQLAALSLSRAGYEIAIEDWDADYGKGIDDVIAAGNGEHIRVIDEQHVWEYLSDLLMRVGQTPDEELSAKAHKRSYAKTDPVQVRNLSLTTYSVPGTQAVPPGHSEAKSESSLPALGPITIGPPATPRSISGGGGGPRMLQRGDDVEIGQMLVSDLSQISGGVLPVYDLGCFWLWNTDHWTEYTSASLMNIIAGYAGLPLPGSKNGPKPLKMSAGLAKGAIAFASAACFAADFFQNAPHGIPFRNGFMKLEESGFVLHQHRPDARQRYVLEFDYDPEAKAPAWEKFLGAVFSSSKTEQDAKERESLLMEGIGVGLMGLGPRYQRAFLLVGNGANGKSTAMQLIKELFPPHTVTSVSPDEFGSPVYRASLAHKMINIVAEIPHRHLRDTPQIKAIISGDDVSGEQKYKDPRSVRCMATHFYSANELPETDDTSDGFFRRWNIILFDKRFSEKERDERMIDKLLRDRSGIAKLAMEHCAGLLKRGGYTTPTSSLEKTKKWREDNDQVRRFVGECCNQTPDFETSLGVLYEAYKKWAASKGVGALSEVKFGNRLQDMDHYKHTSLARRYNLVAKEDVVKAMESSFRFSRRVN